MLAASVRTGAGGRLLVGGEPLRVLRLGAGGPEALRALAEGRASAAQLRLGRRLVAAGLADPHPGPADADATVVIPVRDRAAELDRCLAAAARGAAPVVVVDDGSRAPAAIARVAARHGARVLALAATVGPGAARNAALAHVTSPLVAFLDSDCVPPAGWIEALAGHFADPAVAAAAPRVLPSGGPLDLGGLPGEAGPGRRVSYVPSAALLVRRAALGAFDPGLRYGEDVDLVWRLCDAGWRVRYDPSVAVVHSEPRGRRARLARRFRYGTSAAPLALRHPTRLAPVILPPWPTAALAALAARRPAAALAIAAVHAALLARRGVPPRLAPELALQAVADTARGLGRASGTLAPPLALLTGRPGAAAYGAGVWWGALRHRTPRPLLPLARFPAAP